MTGNEEGLTHRLSKQVGKVLGDKHVRGVEIVEHEIIWNIILVNLINAQFNHH